MELLGHMITLCLTFEKLTNCFSNWLHHFTHINIMSFFKVNLFILFIYFWLCWVFVAACGLFSSCNERGLLFLAVHGLLIAVVSRCGARALGVWASVVVAHRLSSCGTWALGARASVVVAHGLSSCGSWALECELSSCGARA